MLGDIHKYQSITETMAYCGSLIQQNQGESVREHGYIKWDLAKGTHKFYEIWNDYGYITINIKENKFPRIDELPKNAWLRIMSERCNKKTIEDLLEEIKRRGVNY